ncbi:MAG: ferritin family protein [Acidobacteriota bacterium]
MPIPIDFSKLGPQDVLDLASFIEHEAEERYLTFAAHLEVHGDTDGSSFFRRMAALEGGHGAQIEGRRVARFADLPGRVRDAVEWDVEGPRLDRSRTSLAVDEAFVMALASEVRARDFFAAALEHMTEARTAAMLAELHADEVGHVRMIEEEMSRRGLRPVSARA